jgi:hypothetical protein
MRDTITTKLIAKAPAIKVGGISVQPGQDAMKLKADENKGQTVQNKDDHVPGG